MNGAVYTAVAENQLICGVDHRIDVKAGDIRYDKRQPTLQTDTHFELSMIS